MATLLVGSAVGASMHAYVCTDVSVSAAGARLECPDTGKINIQCQLLGRLSKPSYGRDPNCGHVCIYTYTYFFFLLSTRPSFWSTRGEIKVLLVWARLSVLICVTIHVDVRSTYVYLRVCVPTGNTYLALLLVGTGAWSHISLCLARLLDLATP